MTFLLISHKIWDFFFKVGRHPRHRVWMRIIPHWDDYSSDVLYERQMVKKSQPKKRYELSSITS